MILKMINENERNDKIVRKWNDNAISILIK